MILKQLLIGFWLGIDPSYLVASLHSIELRKLRQPREDTDYSITALETRPWPLGPKFQAWTTSAVELTTYIFHKAGLWPIATVVSAYMGVLVTLYYGCPLEGAESLPGYHISPASSV